MFQYFTISLFSRNKACKLLLLLSIYQLLVRSCQKVGKVWYILYTKIFGILFHLTSLSEAFALKQMSSP